MIYFIADLHLGHTNCLGFDNRPFKNIKEQDDFIIDNWNNTIKENDDVYILGDFSWYDATKTIEIFSKLNGRLHLIKGNHDGKLLKNRKVRGLFVEICDYKELTISCDNKIKNIVLSHYPIPCYKNHYWGWYHLYGHVHNGMEYNLTLKICNEIKALFPDKDYEAHNVGAMISYMNYIPRTLEYIISQDK